MDSYIYFGRNFSYEYDKNFTKYANQRRNTDFYKKYPYSTEQEIKEHTQIKIGETGNLKRRSYTLDTTIRRYIKFNGTHDERLFIEAYLRTKYATNPNLHHSGNDHFYAENVNAMKGAENKFFQYIKEAFQILQQITHKEYHYECIIDKYGF